LSNLENVKKELKEVFINFFYEMSLSIDDDWLKPTESQSEDQRDVGHSSSVSGGETTFRQRLFEFVLTFKNDTCKV